jgi:Sec-independent protein translocase protein TatA
MLALIAVLVCLMVLLGIYIVPDAIRDVKNRIDTAQQEQEEKEREELFDEIDEFRTQEAGG